MVKMYVVFIHDKNGIRAFGGVFPTPNEARNVCNFWNEHYETKDKWADFICCEVGDKFILNIDCK